MKPLTLVSLILALTLARSAVRAEDPPRLEPNVTITPDNKWVVFRSNMHSATHTYAVEIARSN